MSDKPILIKNGRIPDRKSGKLIASDILISGGIITALGDIPPKKGYHSVNARGNVIFPAFTDLRTHLFIPPYIRTEDIRTTAAAALAGGYGCLLSAPHAPIPITTPEQIARIIAASGQLPCDIIPVGSVTDAAGKASDFDTLISAGAFALADDSTEDSELIFRTMKYCAENDRLLIMHADTGRGQGSFSDYRGGGKNGCVPEDVRCAAILTLAAKSGCRLHISGVSSGCSAKLISIAKREGVNVSADTSPQYFSMTSEDMLFYGNNVKLARIPLTVDTEEQVVKGCIMTSTKPDPNDAKFVIIRSTKYLDEVYMSRAAVEAADQSRIEVIGNYFDLKFDEHGVMQLYN